jgi:hypothetical protein
MEIDGRDKTNDPFRIYFNELNMKNWRFNRLQNESLECNVSQQRTS